MNHRGMPLEDFLAPLEHARSAPHPYLGVVHVYGAIPWAFRQQYYQALRKLLRRHRMKWAWHAKYLKPGKQGHRRLPDPDRARVEAGAREWLYRGRKEPEDQQPPTARSRFLEAQREAVLPPCWGACSIIENSQ